MPPPIRRPPISYPLAPPSPLISPAWSPPGRRTNLLCAAARSPFPLVRSPISSATDPPPPVRSISVAGRRRRSWSPPILVATAPAHRWSIHGGESPPVSMLLETMLKNSGDYIHFQIVDRNILQEMVKVIKKKRMRVSVPERSQTTLLQGLMKQWQPRKL